MRSLAFLMIISLLLFPLISALSVARDSPLFDYSKDNEPCDLQADDCLPQSDFSFAFCPFSMEKMLANNRPFIQTPFELKKDSEGGLHVFAKTDLKANELLYSAPSDRTINSLEAIDLSNVELVLPFSREQLQLPSLSDHPHLRFILNFLVHMYNQENSQFREELCALDRNIDSPTFTLTPHERKFLVGDHSHPGLEYHLKFVKESYKMLLGVLGGHEVLSKEENLRILFNGRSSVKFEDFLFGYYILLTKTVRRFPDQLDPESDAKKKEEYFFAPILSFLGNKIKIRTLKEPSLELNRQGNLELRTRDDFKSGEEILIDHLSLFNSVYFLERGFVPEENDFDCLRVIMLPDKLSRAWEIDDSPCLRKGGLKHYYSVGQLVNLTPEELSACLANINHIPKTDLKRFDIVFENCPKKEWRKLKAMWEATVAQLKKKRRVWQEQFSEVSKYKLLREEAGRSLKNADLLIKYFKSQLNLAKSLIKEASNYQDMASAGGEVFAKVEL